jgi:cell division inhibitor SulA
MIDYQTFHQIRQLCDQEHLSAAQIAAALRLDQRTVGKWMERKTYQPREQTKRASKLDAHKGAIVRLLAAHDYTSQQLLQRLRESG